MFMKIADCAHLTLHIKVFISECLCQNPTFFLFWLPMADIGGTRRGHTRGKGTYLVGIPVVRGWVNALSLVASQELIL